MQNTFQFFSNPYYPISFEGTSSKYSPEETIALKAKASELNSCTLDQFSELVRRCFSELYETTLKEELSDVDCLGGYVTETEDLIIFFSRKNLDYFFFRKSDTYKTHGPYLHALVNYELIDDEDLKCPSCEKSDFDVKELLPIEYNDLEEVGSDSRCAVYICQTCPTVFFDYVFHHMAHNAERMLSGYQDILVKTEDIKVG